jgi:hypothetical protein
MNLLEYSRKCRKNKLKKNYKDWVVHTDAHILYPNFKNWVYMYVICIDTGLIGSKQKLCFIFDFDRL